ncbi:peptide deformylase [Acidithrix ferrooxidans]|jgi:peptide deformylase|uniref:Peptide deformylase n=1 Tax=Acidithrix ferrooxidans TaxID=1280514 RepID=A0A0D8HC36_9ACTN|nr:peptide deformylase [Acidithrix ferrooxidans]KJF15535.1 peptide deformylase 1 [Acidithrix ferrooxidans]
MAIREVVSVPHPVLSRQALEVNFFDEELAKLVGDMCDTMVVSPGCVGLAAVQIGVPLAIFVADVAGHKKTRSYNGLIVAINPVITAKSKPIKVREGCMSVADFTGAIERFSNVTLRAQNCNGEIFEIETDGFEAQAIQHEVDHLNGMVFLDRIMSPDNLYPRKRYL